MRYLYVVNMDTSGEHDVEWEKQSTNGYIGCNHIYVYYKIFQSNAIKYIVFTHYCLYYVNIETPCMHIHTICFGITKCFENLNDVEGLLGKYKLLKIPWRGIENRKDSMTTKGV